jgi:hypothetical protein
MTIQNLLKAKNKGAFSILKIVCPFFLKLPANLKSTKDQKYLIFM